MMDKERKAELMRKARRCMTRSQFIEYCNYLNNYELRSARNDAIINARDGMQVITL